MAQRFLVIDFEVGKRGLAARAPVDQAERAVYQPLAIETDENFAHRARKPGIEREALAAPVARGAQTAQLVEDAPAVGFLPLPHPRDEGLAPKVVARLALFCQFALDHVLGRDSGMVSARLPERVVTLH